jgi:hypothetical protein
LDDIVTFCHPAGEKSLSLGILGFDAFSLDFRFSDLGIVEN